MCCPHDLLAGPLRVEVPASGHFSAAHGAVQHPCRLLVHGAADVAGGPPEAEPSLDVCGPGPAAGPQELLEQAAFLAGHVQRAVPVGVHAASLRIACPALEIQTPGEDPVRLPPVVHGPGAALHVAAEGIPRPLPARLAGPLVQTERCPMDVHC